MRKLFDVYCKDDVYYIVTEVVQFPLGDIKYESIPLSRWILSSYIGSVEGARNMFESLVRKCEREGAE
jgi:hypothetical protein